jgi:hypothetical protein
MFGMRGSVQCTAHWTLDLIPARRSHRIHQHKVNRYKENKMQTFSTVIQETVVMRLGR